MTAQKTEQDYRDHGNFHEYDLIHFPQILEALRKIDRARQKLIDAQNNLVQILRSLDNEYTEQRFAEFYAAGGVTAADWEASYRKEWQEPNNALILSGHGQLRVVSLRRRSDHVVFK